MNFLHFSLGCNEQCSKHRTTATSRQVDVVIVRPTAWTFVVYRTAELNRDSCTNRPRVRVRLEIQHSLMDVRRALGVHEAEGSEPAADPVTRRSRRRRLECSLVGLGEPYEQAELVGGACRTERDDLCWRLGVVGVAAEERDPARRSLAVATALGAPHVGAGAYKTSAGEAGCLTASRHRPL
jgi:hypothetical protein